MSRSPEISASHLAQVRGDLTLLARLYGSGAHVDCKPLCLNLIDRTASCASARHGELTPHLAGILSAALYAAMRNDVAAVVEQLEHALTQISTAQTTPPLRVPKPRQLPSPRGRATTPAATLPTPSPDPVKPLAQTIDPLLAKLRGKHPQKG